MSSAIALILRRKMESSAALSSGEVSMVTTLTNMLIRLCWRGGKFLTGATALAMGLLYFKQDSLLYFPTVGQVPRRPSQNPRRYRSPSEYGVPFETHSIPAADGVRLHSWLLYQPAPASRDDEKPPTIVFFHGNAGNIGLRLPNAVQMLQYLKANVWLVEYRGYGDSDDAPINEAGLKLDAEAVLNYIHGYDPQTGESRQGDPAVPRLDPHKIFLFGRSLGGAVAFHLAHYAQTHRLPLAGLMLENTFLSISHMVDHLMPLVALFKPLILRIGWDSSLIAPLLSTPVLYLAGKSDTLVPHAHMLELFQLTKQAKRNTLAKIHVVDEGTHNETWIVGGQEYWYAILQFMEQALAQSSLAGITRSGSNAGNSVTSTAEMPSTDIAPTKAVNGITSVGPIHRKPSFGIPLNPSSNDNCVGSPIATKKDGPPPLEVSMGVDLDVKESAIPAVESFLGMAREATRSATANTAGKVTKTE